MPDYNGWTNYETWAVNLWLTNDEHDSAMLSELAQGANDHSWMAQGTGGLREKADILKNWVLDENPADYQASLYSDLLHASLERVNWRQIIENHASDSDEEI